MRGRKNPGSALTAIRTGRVTIENIKIKNKNSFELVVLHDSRRNSLSTFSRITNAFQHMKNNDSSNYA